MTEVLTEVLPRKNYNKVLPIIEYLEKNGEISLKEADSNLHPPAHKMVLSSSICWGGTSLKRKKKMTVAIIMIGIILCFGGIYVFLLRYFFYNKYNLYAQRAMLDSLNKKYNQEFELLSTEFETKEKLTASAGYVHIWTFSLQDRQGRQFHAYVRLYGLVEKGDGNFHEPFMNRIIPAI